MYNSVYTSSGSRNLLEPAITVTHADGNQSLDLQYVSHTSAKISSDVELLNILLKDPVYPVEVTLCYKAYYKENVIEQWSVIVILNHQISILHQAIPVLNVKYLAVIRFNHFLVS